MAKDSLGRTPSWGAWIEIFYTISLFRALRVAPPRGVRGLKSESEKMEGEKMSHPLVGCVD